MPSARVFFTVTSQGQVRKVLRERYMREVQCGSALCDKCEGARILGTRPCSINKLLPGVPHYLCLDVQLYLSQTSTVFTVGLLSDVIVPFTTLEEIRFRSFVIYTQLKTFLLDSERRFYLFLNDFYECTAVEEIADETTQDRKFRSSLASVKFYNDHLADFHVDTIYLSDDIETRNKARQQGVSAFTLQEYLTGIGKADLLESSTAQALLVGDQPSDKICYPAHLSLPEIKDMIVAGSIYQGVFYASSDNCLEGNVVLNDSELAGSLPYNRLLVKGRMNINRAIDEDIVAVEILPDNEWSSPVEIVVEDDDALEDETLEQEDVATKEKGVPSCKIVGIIRRRRTEYCGVIQSTASDELSQCLFIPVNRRIPKIRIETRQIERLKKMKIAVTIDRWPRRSKYPIGHYSRAIGDIGDRVTDSEVLLIEHEIPHYPFSQKVLESLPPSDYKISDQDFADRVDLRRDDICIFSIDPAGCTDIDDALHCRLLSNGNLEVGVHIADVTHFVRPGTAVDLEARLRCNSVYLVDQRIDMLPPVLSTNLCSLRERVDRLAFSVIWEISPNAEILSTRFHRSIIRSRAALEYGQAQLIIDDPSRDDPIAKSLRELNKLAKQLRAKRMQSGALSLESPEIRFVLDSEGGDPLEMLNKEIRETNHLVEEFMLLANMSVAAKIYESMPNCACLRRHPEPNADSLEPLVKAAQSRGIQLDISSGKALSCSLDEAQLKDHPYFNLMLRMLTTRCMTQAVYFCSGKVKEADFKHYGLAAGIYTHFTSPIRRYADVIVHRLLACAIHLGGEHDNTLFDADEMEALCTTMNQRHRQAQQASRDSAAINSLYFFKGKICDEEGYIFSIMRNAFRVLVHRYGIEVLVHTQDSQGKAYLEFNDQDNTLVTPDGRVVLKMFDPVIVQISTEQNPVTARQKLNVGLVSPQIEGLSVSAIR